MKWPELGFSKNKIDEAGKILLEPILNDDDYKKWNIANDVLNNFRSSHGYPINTFQATLRKNIKRIDSAGIVAQRLKRRESILAKLDKENRMALSRMQDIGGVRAIVTNIQQVYNLSELYKTKTRFKHKLIKENGYISTPKESGYRSVHLIYTYINGRNQKYNGLKIELQIRTKLQHIWATAVETVGTFLQHSLKSSIGPNDWLEYFRLAGSSFALREKCSPVASLMSLSENDHYSQLINMSSKLEVQSTFDALRTALKMTTKHTDLSGRSYYLVEPLIAANQVRVTGFSRDSLVLATDEYAKAEVQAEKENRPVVLVSAGSINLLRRAYPNYFLDVSLFTREIAKIKNQLGTHSKGVQRP